MKVFLDTNIIIDTLVKERVVLFPNSVTLARLCSTKFIEGYTSSLTILNLMYIMRNSNLTESQKRAVINTLAAHINIVDLDAKSAVDAANMQYHDYEDYVQLQQAIKCKSDYLVTRDLGKGFPKDGTLGMKVRTTKEMLLEIATQYTNKIIKIDLTKP